MTTQQPRRLVIGDIHGHYQGLQALLSLLDLAESDQVYFLGDLIDRGPHSSQVVDLVKENAYACLRGNHEQLMVAAFAQLSPNGSILKMWMQAGGKETLASYNSQQHLREHLSWFRSLPNYLDLGDFWLVHAGIHPNMPLEFQTEQEFCWIRREFHHMPEPYFAHKTIITGHTMTFTFSGVEPGQIVQGAGWLGIDTGAYHPQSGWLTALDLSSLTVFQINIHSGLSRINPLSDVVVPLEYGHGSRAMPLSS